MRFDFVNQANAGQRLIKLFGGFGNFSELSCLRLTRVLALTKFNGIKNDAAALTAIIGSIVSLTLKNSFIGIK